VLLAVTVGEGGAPREVVVLRSSGSPLLDGAACEAARDARFTPAREGEHAVASVKQVAFTFRLDDEEGEW
jgi:protein TonB